MTDQRVAPVWPVLRGKMPKHFVPLIGGRTMLQQSAQPPHPQRAICRADLHHQFGFLLRGRRADPARGVKATVILEPRWRDSGAAIAAEWVPSALLVVAADHLIPEMWRPHVAVLPVSFRRSDIGNWKSVWSPNININSSRAPTKLR